MVDMKSTVYNLLKTLSNNVSYAFPDSFVTLPTVSYMEIVNNEAEKTLNGQEVFSTIAFQVDIWAKTQTELMPIFSSINTAMQGLEFNRDFKQEVKETVNGTNMWRYILRYSQIRGGN